MQSESSWSQCAESYAKDDEIQEYYSQLAAVTLLSNVKDNEPIQFLDVAAGPGELSIDVWKLLSEHQRLYSSCEITDFSPGMLNIARKIVAEREAGLTTHNQFDVMDAQALTFPDDTFTHIGCMFGIMFLPDPTMGLSEMYRVLQKGGRIVLGTWHEIGNMPIVLGFAKYLKLHNLDECIVMLNSVVKVCGDCAMFVREMEAVGFTNVNIVQEKQTFLEPNDEKFFLANANNAAMHCSMGGENALNNYGAWQEYLRTDGACWLTPEGMIRMQFVANIATASKI